VAGTPASGELTTGPAAAAEGGFSIASHADDAGLRAMLRQSPTPGAVCVAFTREPSYARAEGLAGAVDTTLVHRTGGTLDGMARLSVSVLHRNGAPTRAGYLGELRIDPGARRTVHLLRDGFACLREHVISNGVRGAFTSIALDNERARRVLEHGGRLGLPAYLPIADMVTLVARVREPRRGPVPAVAADAGREELTDFLSRHARAGQLTPTWDEARWDAFARHGLESNHFHVVREDGRIVAAAALWDQRTFRQVVVDGYGGMLSTVRPALNLFSRVGLAPPLPAPGSILPQAMIAGACADAAPWWQPLLAGLMADAAVRGLEWLVVARDVRDPVLAILRRLLRAREYRTRLYEVRFEGVPSWKESWNGLPFRPEVGLL
jgi:hypothetical protein